MPTIIILMIDILFNYGKYILEIGLYYKFPLLRDSFYISTAVSILSF